MTENLISQLTHYRNLTAPVLQGYFFMKATNICFGNVKFTVLAENWILFVLQSLPLQIFVPLKAENLWRSQTMCPLNKKRPYTELIMMMIIMF